MAELFLDGYLLTNDADFNSNQFKNVFSVLKSINKKKNTYEAGRIQIYKRPFFYMHRMFTHFIWLNYIQKYSFFMD